MTRIALTADLHVDSYGPRVDPDTGLPARLVDYLRTTTWVASEAKRRECDALLVLGDLTESRRPAPWLVALIQEALSAGPERVIVTRGNHDQQNAGRSIVDILGRRSGWDGIDRPRVVRVGDLAIAGIGYLDRHHLRSEEGLAAIPEADLLPALAQQYLAIARGLYAQAIADGAKDVILVGHQSLSGGFMTEQQQAFLGDMSLVLDTAALAPIGFRMVAMGHFHLAQTVSDDPACPVVYPGSIERVDFGEADQTKSFLVVDVEDGRATYERVETPARRFVTLTAEAGYSPDDIAGAIVRGVDLDPTLDIGHVRSMLEADGAFEVQALRHRAVESTAPSTAMSETLSPAETLGEWFAGDEDRGALVERGLAILAEVAA